MEKIIVGGAYELDAGGVQDLWCPSKQGELVMDLSNGSGPLGSLGGPIEIAPQKTLFSGETVFGGAGNSHFSFVPEQGFHVTTQVPGFGMAEGLSNGLPIRDLIKDMGLGRL